MDAPPDDPTRYSGYRPRRPVPEDEPAPAAARSDRRRSAPSVSRGAVAPGLAALLVIAALVVGLIVGWMARGGPADPELVVQTQPVPAVTVTREVAP